MEMQKNKPILPSAPLVESIVLAIISGITYLVFVPQFGYFNDDWYLMYAAGARGASVFWDIFAIDRPLRALVMIPAYTLFGPNPLYYNLTAFLSRLMSGIFFLWILRMVWPDKKHSVFWMALLFLLYPGFLSQPNAIDYLCHLTGLAAGMLSIGLTIKAAQVTQWARKTILCAASILLGWFYLGQIEWYIGLEFFRFACLFVLSFRGHESMWTRLVGFFRISIPMFLIPGVFLTWRLFFFESKRGATDLGFQLSDLRGAPLKFAFDFLFRLLNDFIDVWINAWWLPLRRLSAGFTISQWLLGFGIAALALVFYWLFSKARGAFEDIETDQGTIWKREVVLIGLGAIVFGLFSVLLVGRSVDFKYFSRYTLIASVGAALLWPLLLSYIPNVRLRNILLSVLFVSAVLTHFANGLVKARETQSARNFWWQVGWRIPQMQVGTTLVVHYSVVAEEDYFTWGPANLIYYPQSNNDQYVQPSIYAVLLNQETIDRTLARESQSFSNRRSIRTYPNYRNLLILSQPKPTSCVQILDLNQLEISSFEDPRIISIAPYSELEHVLTDELFHALPEIPFDLEPSHEWCYYYEKAAYARQMEDWVEVARLGEEARSLGFFASDQIEWMPFLQAYAQLDNVSALNRIASLVGAEPAVTKQACQILTSMSLSVSVMNRVNDLFCLNR